MKHLRNIVVSLRERGSILLDTVLFLALLSVLSMALIGQLVFMTKVSAQEDARVQGLMAARIQLEDMRTNWTHTSATEDEEFTPVSFESEFDTHRLGKGYYSITVNGPNLYQVEIRIRDKADTRDVCRTLSQVWDK